MIQPDTVGIRNPAGPTRLQRRFAPSVPWLVLPYIVAVALANGVSADGWRTPVEAALTVDPTWLLPLRYYAAVSVAQTAQSIATTAALFAPIGVMVWLRRGPVPGAGIIASGLAFYLSLVIEVGRWFKSGLVPDPNAPLIAAAAAYMAWRLMSALWRIPVSPARPASRWGARFRALVKLLLLGCLLGAASALGGAVYFVDAMRLTPSQLASFIDEHTFGRHGVSMDVASAVTSWLAQTDRLERRGDDALPTWTGANERNDGQQPAGPLRLIGTVAELRRALGSARPGDVIQMQPGIYRVQDEGFGVGQPGTPDAPIVLRAEKLGTVVIEAGAVETFKVSAPNWHFENLVVRGVCGNDSNCEHAFHVVGEVDHTVIRNVRLEDYNAQIKINGEYGRFPDGGRIEHSTLIDTRPRRTDNPVAAIDLDAASDWTINNNLIVDFVKDGGNRTSYGAYAKAAGRGTVFARNVVLCEWRLRRFPGERIGLSFGGGGSDKRIRRDRGLSGYEQADATMRGNLVAFCSDDGIYINRAPGSVLTHNTLIDTAGIDVRFPESLAQLDANLVDGSIRARDDGLLWSSSDWSSSLLELFLGRHPLRALFADPASLDLRWRNRPTGDDGAMSSAEPDLCGASWQGRGLPGAFDDFAVCLRLKR